MFNPPLLSQWYKISLQLLVVIFFLLLITERERWETPQNKRFASLYGNFFQSSYFHPLLLGAFELGSLVFCVAIQFTFLNRCLICYPTNFTLVIFNLKKNLILSFTLGLCWKFSLFIWKVLHLFIHVFTYWQGHKCTTKHLWGPEYNAHESALSFCFQSPGDGIQAALLGSKCLYPLSHLASPLIFISVKNHIYYCLPMYVCATSHVLIDFHIIYWNWSLTWTKNCPFS